MNDAGTVLALLCFAAAGLALASLAALSGWRGWLELKRLELSASPALPRGRTELATLRERIRRLEAIADGCA